MEAGAKREKFMLAIEPVVPFAGRAVLEVGCGKGERSGQIASRCRHLIGVDPDQEAVQLAGRRNISNASFEPGRAENLRFGNERFGIVIFTSSFHHVPIAEMSRAVYEAIATCRRDGIIVFYEPAVEKGSFYEAEVLFGAYDGDESEAKRAAHETIHNHPGLTILEELTDETEYRFRSYGDFVRATNPNRNLGGIERFLHEHEYVLHAPRLITVCRPY